MKKLLTVVAFALVSQASFAGSDHLICSTKDNSIILNGSIWNMSSEIHELRIQSVERLKIATLFELTTDATLMIENTKEEVADEIKKAQTETLKDYKDRYVISKNKEKILKDEVMNACREVGDKVSIANLSITHIYTQYNYKTEKSDLKTEVQKNDFNCQYTYATAPGGGPECYRE